MLNLLARFSTKDIDALAKSMAGEISKRYPPDVEPSAKKRKHAPGRLSQILNEVYAKTDPLRTERPLGVYRKAKLGNTFRWELTELGYDKEFVDMATQGLVIHLTRKAGAPATKASKPGKDKDTKRR